MTNGLRALAVSGESDWRCHSHAAGVRLALLLQRAYNAWVGGDAGPVAAAAKLEPMPEAWVYLLRCRDGSLYTGWTVDLERRLARHRAGTASRYTASRLPIELELAVPMPSRTAARREEARIKRLSRAAKLAMLG
jgi:putative endonuclease